MNAVLQIRSASATSRRHSEPKRFENDRKDATYQEELLRSIRNPKPAANRENRSPARSRIPRKTPSLIVPDAAVVFDAQGVYVFVVENGVVRQHKITEIRDLGTEMEVSEGVKAGDLAVVNPPVDLEDGKKVKIRTGDAAR
jgi:hypothetical protein